MKRPIPLDAPQSSEPDRLTVSRSEAARMLGISERLLWTLTNRKEVPHLRIGTRVLYPVRSLQQWLESRTTSTSGRRDY